MCIAIICFLVCDVIKFEINLSLLIKPFSYMTKKSGEKLRYLENKNSFTTSTVLLLITSISKNQSMYLKLATWMYEFSYNQFTSYFKNLNKMENMHAWCVVTLIAYPFKTNSSRILVAVVTRALEKKKTALTLSSLGFFDIK